MDGLDQNILRHLMHNAHMTNSKLAKRIGLSESATLERVRRLESSGVIEGYTVRVEPAQVDRGLELFVAFTLHNQSNEALRHFETAMREMEEVLTCAQTLGRFDFIAHIAVRDASELSRFINQKLIPLGCIERMESMTVLNMLKRNCPPLPPLPEAPVESEKEFIFAQ